MLTGSVQCLLDSPLCRYTTTTAFLQMMSALVQREPAVFLQAVARTCALDANRGETMIRLKTARELQQQPSYLQTVTSGGRESAAGASSAGGTAAGSAGRAAAGSSAGGDAGSGPAAPPASGGPAAGEPAGQATPKPSDQRDSAAGDKVPKSAAKPHKKLVPSNFVEVVDALLDVVMAYNGAPRLQQQQQQPDAGGPAAMELDQRSPRQGSQQQDAGAATAASTAESRAAAERAPPAAAAAGAGETAPLPADLLLRRLNPLAREVGIQAMVLRLLGDYCLLYNNTVGLLLKRDSEAGPAADLRGQHPHTQHSTPGPHQASQHTPGPAGTESRTARRSSTRHKENSSSGGQQPSESHKAGVVLKHIMTVQLVDQLPPWVPSTSNVSANASSLLQAVCIRSAEGRRRILHELVATLNSSIQGPQQQQPGSAGPLPVTVSV